VRTFIQWKGTDVCMDFYCDCGTDNHYDAEFAYFVRCSGCRRVFRVGTEVTMTETTDTRGHEPRKSVL
jgi:hypothetical protein